MELISEKVASNGFATSIIGLKNDFPPYKNQLRKKDKICLHFDDDIRIILMESR
jgi:hypothetical protein